MTKPKIALNPKHPERVCWGCDKYCSAHDLRCGNGTIRTQHPVELFGEDWIEWKLDLECNRLKAPAVAAEEHEGRKLFKNFLIIVARLDAILVEKAGAIKVAKREAPLRRS